MPASTAARSVPTLRSARLASPETISELTTNATQLASQDIFTTITFTHVTLV